MTWLNGVDDFGKCLKVVMSYKYQHLQCAEKYLSLALDRGLIDKKDHFFLRCRLSKAVEQNSN